MILHAKLMDDGVPLHLISSSCAGFVATVVGSPVDVIKTRVMNADKSKGNVSAVSVITKLIKKEGFGSFYNGFGANASRIVSWNMAMFVTWGQMKKHLGHNYEKKLHWN